MTSLEDDRKRIDEISFRRRHGVAVRGDIPWLLSRLEAALACVEAAKEDCANIARCNENHCRACFHSASHVLDKIRAYEEQADHIHDETLCPPKPCSKCENEIQK